MPRGRKPTYQEFLLTLLEATGLSTPQLARACGKPPTNMGQYRLGSKQPGLDTIRGAISSLRDSWPVFDAVEVQTISQWKKKLPQRPGIYALYGSAGNVLYVGQATNLRAEVAQTLNRRANSVVRLGPVIRKKICPKYGAMVAYITAYVVPAARLRHNLEALLLRVFLNQTHNNKMGNFKRTPWGLLGKPLDGAGRPRHLG
jgi:transcriptional regulator with XRE-family HTH domain